MKSKREAITEISETLNNSIVSDEMTQTMKQN